MPNPTPPEGGRRAGASTLPVRLPCRKRRPLSHSLVRRILLLAMQTTPVTCSPCRRAAERRMPECNLLAPTTKLLFLGFLCRGAFTCPYVYLTCTEIYLRVTAVQRSRTELGYQRKEASESHHRDEGHRPARCGGNERVKGLCKLRRRQRRGRRQGRFRGCGGAAVKSL